MSTNTNETRTRRANALIGGGSDVRRVEKNEREYLVFPVVAAREMVLNYPEFGRNELLPAESFQKTADLWAGQPITAGHPRENTASTAEAYTRDTYGQVHEPDASDDALTLKAWVDVDRAESIGGTAQAVVDRLDAGREVAVSTGYDTVGDQRENGRYNGEQYDLIQGDVIPDHLAVFPPDEYRARCSLDDGCGAPRANAVMDQALADGLGHDATERMTDNEPIDPSLAHRVLGRLGYGDGAEASHVNAGHEHEECGCDGECDDCRANASESGEGAGDDPPDEGGEAENGNEDGGDPSDDADDTTHMADDTIENLAEQTTWSEDELSEWDEDDLDALEETMSVALDSDDAGGDADAATTENAGGDDAPEQDAETDGELEELVRQNAESINDLGDRVEDLHENIVADEYADEIRTVTNAIDEMDEETAQTMAEQNPEALRSLADEHGTETRVNHGGIPGSVDRTPDASDEDFEEYSAGTRSDYETRTGGD